MIKTNHRERYPRIRNRQLVRALTWNEGDTDSSSSSNKYLLIENWIIPSRDTGTHSKIANGLKVFYHVNMKKCWRGHLNLTLPLWAVDGGGKLEQRYADRWRVRGSNLPAIAGLPALCYHRWLLPQRCRFRLLWLGWACCILAAAIL